MRDMDLVIDNFWKIKPCITLLQNIFRKTSLNTFALVEKREGCIYCLRKWKTPAKNETPMNTSIHGVYSIQWDHENKTVQLLVVNDAAREAAYT